jgi:L,D-transpeptidase ErfK/SrfK
MAVTPKTETLTHPIMFLCLGVALLLLLHWGSRVIHSMTALHRSTTPAPKSSQPVPSASSSQLVVDLSDRRVYVFIRDRQVSLYPIAIGQTGWETPIGQFQVLQMQQNPDWVHPITGEVVKAGPKNPLGRRWIGFLSDGHNQIGFHGTPQEELIGQAVSHGCIRMRNQDVEALYKQVQVGTPILVRP